MPPCKVASKEVSEISTEEDVEVTKLAITINEDTQCFIDKSTKVTLSNIYNTFMQESFLAYLEELYVNINMNKPRMRKVT